MNIQYIKDTFSVLFEKREYNYNYEEQISKTRLLYKKYIRDVKNALKYQQFFQTAKLKGKNNNTRCIKIR
jgi:hypothetical protein